MNDAKLPAAKHSRYMVDVHMWVTVCSYVTCITDNYCYNHHYTTMDPVHLKYYSSTLSAPLC